MQCLKQSWKLSAVVMLESLPVCEDMTAASKASLVRPNGTPHIAALVNSGTC